MSNDGEMNSTVDTTVNATKKKSFLPICVVLLVAIVIGIGGFYYYFGTPKKIVTTVLNDAYANYDEMINEGMDLDLSKDSFKMTGNLVVDTNIPGFDKIKNDKINYTLGMDPKNEKLEVGASLIEGKTTLIDVIAYVIDNKTYLSLGDDYKNLINMGNADLDFSELLNLESVSFSKDDINYIVEAYKDILIESIDYDELKKSSDTIEIDGKDTKVTKITYTLNKDNIEKLVKNIIDGTLDNDKLLDKLAKLTDTDKKEIKESLKEAKKDVNVEKGTKLELSIYTKGFSNKFAGLELKSDDVTMNVTKNENSTNYRIQAEGFDFNIDVKEYSNEKVDIDLVVKAGGQTFKGSLVATDKETKKDTHEGDFKLNVTYDKYKFNIAMDYKLEKNAKVADVNTKNAVTAEKASADLEKAATKIMTRLQRSNIYEIIEGLSSLYAPSTTSYSYDY